MQLKVFAFALFLSLVCEEGYTAPSWRIINGQETLQNEYPSIVSIRFYSSHLCGGTLLDNTTVLTAAHCLFNRRSYPVNSMKVRAGEHNFGVSHTRSKTR